MVGTIRASDNGYLSASLMFFGLLCLISPGRRDCPACSSPGSSLSCRVPGIDGGSRSIRSARRSILFVGRQRSPRDLLPRVPSCAAQQQLGNTNNNALTPLRRFQLVHDPRLRGLWAALHAPWLLANGDHVRSRSRGTSRSHRQATARVHSYRRAQRETEVASAQKLRSGALESDSDAPNQRRSEQPQNPRTHG